MYTLYAARVDKQIETVKQYSSLELAQEAIGKDENLLYRLVDPQNNYTLHGVPVYDLWDRELATRFALQWWDLWDPDRIHRNNIMSEEDCFVRQLDAATNAHETFNTIKECCNDMRALIMAGKVIAPVDYFMLRRCSPPWEVIKQYFVEMDLHSRTLEYYNNHPPIATPTSLLQLQKASKLVFYKTDDGGFTIQQIAFLKSANQDPFKTLVNDLLVSCIQHNNLELFSKITKAANFLDRIFFAPSLLEIIVANSARKALVAHFGKTSTWWRLRGWDDSTFMPLKKHVELRKEKHAYYNTLIY